MTKDAYTTDINGRVVKVDGSIIERDALIEKSLREEEATLYDPESF